jgi:hypothetical protein
MGGSAHGNPGALGHAGAGQPQKARRLQRRTKREEEIVLRYPNTKFDPAKPKQR